MSKIVKNVSTLTRLLHLAIVDNKGYQIIRNVRRSGLTFLGVAPLLDIYQQIQEIETRQTPGTLIEAGTALGGSALVMASGKKSDRLLQLYDIYDMIPPPTEKDGVDAHQRFTEIKAGKATGINNEIYYGYQENLLESVKKSFLQRGIDPKTNRIEFIRGLYQDTLIVNAPVALAHIDCDWYESVMVCLEMIVPYLVQDGILVIDDYHQWSGCKSAVDDFFADKKESFRFQMKSRLHIIRR